MKSEKGNVLLFVIVTSFVVTVIVLTALTATGHFTKSVQSVSEMDIVRQQNSAALRAAIAEVQKYEAVADLPATVNFLNRNILVEVVSEQNGIWSQLKLTVEGAINDSKHVVEQQIKKAPPYPFSYTFYADEVFDLLGVYSIDIVGEPFAIYGGTEIKANTTFSQPIIDGWITYSDSSTLIDIKGQQTCVCP